MVESGLPLLLTRLNIPAAYPGWVGRPRLFDRLERVFNGAIAILSAPAGYGKSALLAQWVAYCQGPRRPEAAGACQFAWLSLDEGDNDPVRFWSYLVASLQACPAGQFLGKDFLDTLHSLPGAPLEQALVLLINAITRLPAGLVLVMDDFQLITAAAVLSSLAVLLDRLPANLHILIASRGDPALPLARLRAGGRLVEVRATDLRFTSQEIAAFFQASCGLDLTPVDLAALDQRTEGWVAGLQLAALSLEGQADKLAFIRSFTGSDRYVLDYLSEEILSRQPDAVQRFLLRTAILGRMCAALCAALLSGAALLDEPAASAAACQAMLESLERANLFIVPLDNRRAWYRYHRLFADLLQARLEQASPEDLPGLHRRAATWLAANNQPLEAFRHALSAGDLEMAVGVVESSLVGLVEQAEVVTLQGMLDAFPLDYVRSHPTLCLAHAWCSLYGLQFDRVEAWVQRAAEVFRPGEETPFAQAQMDALRATAAVNHKDFALANQLSRRALENFPAEWRIVRGLLYLNLGDAAGVEEDNATAVQAYQDALEALHPSDNRTLEVVVIGSLGNLYQRLGRFHQAESVLQQALLVEKDLQLGGGGELPACGKSLVYLAHINLEWNRLDIAAGYAAKAVDYCEKWGHRDHLLDAYLVQAEINQAEIGQAQGDPAAWQANLAKARRLAELPGMTGRPEEKENYLGRIAYAEARLGLLAGNFEVIEGVLDELKAHPGSPAAGFNRMQSLLAGYWLAKGQATQASSQAESLYNRAVQHGWLLQQADALILLALAAWQLGDQVGAFEAFGQALVLAQPEGYIHTFVEKEGFLPAGHSMQSLATAFTDTYAAAYTAAKADRNEPQPGSPGAVRLPAAVAAFLDEIRGVLMPARPAAATSLPVLKLPFKSEPPWETFSERERQILRLLSGGLSNAEIAAALYLSTNTIKTHLKRIYARLDAGSRLEAVNKARKLKLI